MLFLKETNQKVSHGNKGIFSCCQLTPWLPATNISYLEIELKSSIFQLSYQPQSSSADCDREQFKLEISAADISG